MIRKALFDVATFAVARLANDSDAHDMASNPVKAAPAGMTVSAVASEHVASGKRREDRMFARRLVRLDRGTGVTRNISASGVFFVTGGDYVPGNKIDFTIELAGLRGGTLMQGGHFGADRLRESFGLLHRPGGQLRTVGGH